VARDYAKGKQRKGQRKRAPRQQGGGLRIFAAGVVTGVFASFILYLAMLPQPADPAGGAAETPQPAAEPPEPKFEFYTMLREQTFEADVEPPEVEPASDLGNPPPPAASREVYLLQAGSFRQREDADRRRAELLLLGLEPSVQEIDGDNGRWHRVYLGPFESRSQMNRARSLTANQDIDTLVLKRNQP